MRAVNLIPPDERAGGGTLGGRSGGAAYLVIGLLVGLAALAALYASAHHEIAVKEGEASKLSAEAAQAQQEANELAPYTRFVALRDARVSDVQQLAGTRFDWAHLMHELGRVLPSDAALSGVQGAVEGSAAGSTSATTPPPASTSTSTSTSASTGAAASSVTSSTPAGSAPALTLTGCATTQSAVALTMERLRLMNGVSEVSLQSSSQTGSSAAGSGGGAGCEAVSFSLSVDFEGLPTPQTGGGASSGTAQSTSDTQGAASAGAGQGTGR